MKHNDVHLSTEYGIRTDAVTVSEKILCAWEYFSQDDLEQLISMYGIDNPIIDACVND